MTVLCRIALSRCATLLHPKTFLRGTKQRAMRRVMNLSIANNCLKLRTSYTMYLVHGKRPLWLYPNHKTIATTLANREQINDLQHILFPSSGFIFHFLCFIIVYTLIWCQLKQPPPHIHFRIIIVTELLHLDHPQYLF